MLDLMNGSRRTHGLLRMMALHSSSSLAWSMQLPIAVVAAAGVDGSVAFRAPTAGVDDGADGRVAAGVPIGSSRLRVLMCLPPLATETARLCRLHRKVNQ